MAHVEEKTGIAVPFHLDSSLGPNRADVLLVMSRFSIELAGHFTVIVSKMDFQIAAVEITGRPFELRLADDCPVRITEIEMERDLNKVGSAGTLLPDETESNLFQVHHTVPIQIRMQVHFHSAVEHVSFTTPFTVTGTIGHGGINLVGSFSLQLDKHHRNSRTGSCDVILNASSVLSCQFTPEQENNAILLSFLGREARLQAVGAFTVGLDGLDIHIQQFALAASPLHLPGLLSTREIYINLDATRPPALVDFRLIPAGEEEEENLESEENPGPRRKKSRYRYHVQAILHARLSTQLTFQDFAAQPFEAPLQLYLLGSIGLESVLHLHLNQEIELAIGEGRLRVHVQTRLQATSIAQTDANLGHAPNALDDPRRRLYAALRAVPEPPFGSDATPLIATLSPPSPDRTARLLAVEALERLGGTTLQPHLESTLQHDPWLLVRLAAVQALGRLPGSSQADALLRCFQSESNEYIRLTALDALGTLGNPLWLSAAQSGLHDPSEMIRCHTALIIARHGGPACSELLGGMLRDKSHFVQLSAAFGLMRANHEEALDTVLRLLFEDSDMYIQIIGSVLLGQSTNEKARSALRRKLEECKDFLVRQAILYALSRQGIF
jgi:hypothetical protein